MMKKMVVSVLICFSLLCLSACESKAEKRARLQAELEVVKQDLADCFDKGVKKHSKTVTDQNAQSVGRDIAFKCNKKYEKKIE
ncbi:MAG: hypothetical protein IKZ88_10645 [Neisseriaceae bacterium]|nr:hypothetical protein [Neisseriaceae bacterium]